MNPVRVWAVSLCVFSASTVFAAISKQYTDFITGPAHYALTKDEVAAWKSVTTDAEAQAFIELFFARRDPTPGTPANEFRDGFEQRIQVANSNFGDQSPGSMTDRGRVFILMGAPTRLRKSQQGPASGTIQTGPAGFVPPSATTLQGYSPKETWTYDQTKTPFKLGRPSAEIAFIDQYGANEYKIERTAKTDFLALFEFVANSFVTNDGRATVAVAAPATTPAPAGAVVPSANGLTSESLRSAIAEARGANATAPKLFVTHGEFLTGDGTPFVAVQLYAPKTAGLAAEGGYTFFGSVENEAGESVAGFEDPATLTASQDSVWVARSLALPPGTYRGFFGLAKGGAPVSVASMTMTLRGVDPAGPAASTLILSTDLKELLLAGKPADPFTFGRVKIVPKSDRTFSASDELWYFFELRKPGLDPTTSQPKLLLRLSVTGKTNEGKPIVMNAAPNMIAAQEFGGAPGHWGVGQTIPLASFRPGTYKITARVTDQTLQKTHTLEQEFRIAE